MAYFPNFQPYPYQDQLNQLRTANPMTNPMPMQGFQAPPQMPMQPPRQDPNGLIWVQGEAGAKSWFVAPGATVLLMDSENPRFYIKSANMNGVPAMDTFEYYKVGEQKLQEVQQSANFVTVEAFNEFRDDMLKRIENLSAPVEVSLSRRKKGVSENE